VEKRAPSTSLLHAILSERVITILTRFVDALIIWFLTMDPEHGINGITKAFVIVTPIYLAACILVVLGNDIAIKKGWDPIGIEGFRQLEHAVLLKNQWFKRLVRRILMSKRLIFWIGSWFYIDPDYVTLLIRKKEEGYLVTFLRITLPSVLISMVVWLGIYWAGFQGYKWAVWMMK